MGELHLPHTRREIDDVFRRMLAHALQYIDQAGGDIDTMQVAIRLWMIPTCLAPSSVQQKSQLRRL